MEKSYQLDEWDELLAGVGQQLGRACPIWSEISNYFLTGQKSIPMVSSDFRF